MHFIFSEFVLRQKRSFADGERKSTKAGQPVFCGVANERYSGNSIK